jgi:hypothetical protein
MQRGTDALDNLNRIPGLHPYLIDSIDQGLKMLQIDRLDATFLTNPGSDSLVRAAGLKPADYGWLEVEAKPVVIYISRKGPLGQDTAALHRLRAVMERLLQQYRRSKTGVRSAIRS